MAKSSTRVPPRTLKLLPVLRYIFEHVSLDLITYLPVTACGHDSILTIVDRLSKLVYFIPCKEAITAEEIGAVILICGGCIA